MSSGAHILNAEFLHSKHTFLNANGSKKVSTDWYGIQSRQIFILSEFDTLLIAGLDAARCPKMLGLPLFVVGPEQVLGTYSEENGRVWQPSYGNAGLAPCIHVRTEIEEVKNATTKEPFIKHLLISRCS